MLAAAMSLASSAAAQMDGLLGDGPSDSFWSDGLLIGIGSASLGLGAVLGILYYLGVGGLRHIDKDNVLKHPMRQSLLEIVENEPGVHLRELAHRHGTAVTNTQWHLRKLELADLVCTRKVQGRRLYYPKAGGIQMREVAEQNAAMQNPNARRIAELLDANAGINQRGIAEKLVMNPGTVRWHLRKLEAASLVRAIPEGTHTRYYLTSPVQRPPRPAVRTREAVAVEDQE